MTKEIQLTSGLRPIKLATFDVDLKKTLMWFSVVPNSPVPEHQIQKYLKLCSQKISVVPNNRAVVDKTEIIEIANCFGFRSIFLGRYTELKQ